MITIGSLFDGISGFPLAGERLGMTTLWSSEIEPFPMKVSDIRFPDMEQKGDITKIDVEGLQPVDIICGGSPCQDLSVAGKRAGLAGARSGLFLEQIRIIKELRNKDGKSSGTNGLIRPRFMVWENVPGAFSSNFGEDFWAVLEETAKITDETITIPEPTKKWDKKANRWRYIWNTFGAIMGNGWSIAWRVLDAQYWGVPQRRRRIFLVADFGGQSAPEVLFKREGLSRHIAKGGKEREGTSYDVERSTNKTNECLTPWDVQSRRIHIASGKWPALYGGEGGGHGYAAIPKVSRTASGVDIYNFNMTGDKAATLNANSGSSPTHSGPSVLQSILPFNATQITSPKNGNNPKYGDPCHPLCATDYAPYIVENTYQKVTGPLMANSHPGSYTGQDAYNDMFATSIDCINHKENTEISGTLCSKNKPGYSLNYQNPVRVGYSVRRLTPLECERLQDYPDGWTDIPGASDSARYKSLGNSVAVCCPEYVLEGIKEVIEREGEE